MGKVAVSFTGGKDSVLALHLAVYNIALDKTDQGAALQALTAAAAAAAAAAGAAAASGDATTASSAISLLVTFAPQGHDKPGQGFKAHPIPVIRAQARALGIPHLVCVVDSLPSPLEGYRQHMQTLHQQYGITQLVTGDILDVADGFMQKAVDRSGVTLVTPLWQLPRERVLEAVLATDIDCIISCINASKYGNPNKAVPCLLQEGSETPAAEETAAEAAGLWDAAAALLGRQVTPKLVAGPLAEAQRLFGADLGGELGEYHTLVRRAPLFLHPVDLSVLEVVRSGDYAYVLLDMDHLA